MLRYPTWMHQKLNNCTHCTETNTEPFHLRMLIQLQINSVDYNNSWRPKLYLTWTYPYGVRLVCDLSGNRSSRRTSWTPQRASGPRRKPQGLPTSCPGRSPSGPFDVRCCFCKSLTRKGLMPTWSTSRNSTTGLGQTVGASSTKRMSGWGVNRWNEWSEILMHHHCMATRQPIHGALCSLRQQRTWTFGPRKWWSQGPSSWRGAPSRGSPGREANLPTQESPTPPREALERRRSIRGKTNPPGMMPTRSTPETEKELKSARISTSENVVRISHKESVRTREAISVTSAWGLTPHTNALGERTEVRRRAWTEGPCPLLNRRSHQKPRRWRRRPTRPSLLLQDQVETYHKTRGREKRAHLRRRNPKGPGRDVIDHPASRTVHPASGETSHPVHRKKAHQVNHWSHQHRSGSSTNTGPRACPLKIGMRGQEPFCSSPEDRGTVIWLATWSAVVGS